MKDELYVGLFVCLKLFDGAYMLGRVKSYKKPLFILEPAMLVSNVLRRLKDVEDKNKKIFKSAEVLDWARACNMHREEESYFKEEYVRLLGKLEDFCTNYDPFEDATIIFENPKIGKEEK